MCGVGWGGVARGEVDDGVGGYLSLRAWCGGKVVWRQGGVDVGEGVRERVRVGVGVGVGVGAGVGVGVGMVRLWLWVWV